MSKNFLFNVKKNFLGDLIFSPQESNGHQVRHEYLRKIQAIFKNTSARQLRVQIG